MYVFMQGLREMLNISMKYGSYGQDSELNVDTKDKEVQTS